MKNDTSPGTDGISNKTLKAIIHLIADPLCHIFCLYMTHGVFPKKLKNAAVIPIIKNSDKNLDNIMGRYLFYLYFLILENVLNKINPLFRKLHLLSPNQFGFHNNLSIGVAIFNVTTKIIK